MSLVFSQADNETLTFYTLFMGSENEDFPFAQPLPKEPEALVFNSTRLY